MLRCFSFYLVAMGALLYSPTLGRAEAKLPVHLYDRDGIQVDSIDAGKNLIFHIRVPEPIRVSFNVDRNQNGQTDPHIDTSYGTTPGDRICTQYWLGENVKTNCEGFGSNAKLNHITREAGMRDYTLTVPKKELSFKVPSVKLYLAFYDLSIKREFCFPVCSFRTAFTLPFDQ